MFMRTATARRSILGTRRRGQLLTSRFNSNTGRNSNPEVLPLTAGITGGMVALLGGYAWYYFSGTKEVLDKARRTAEMMESIKAAIATNAPSPIGVLSCLNSLMEQQPETVSGAVPVVEIFFGGLDGIENTHREEADRILSDTYGELCATVSSEGLNEETGWKIAEILRRRGQELKNLGKDLGQEILEKNPQLRDKLQASMAQLKKLGRQYGPEAQKIVDDAYRQVQDIVNQGVNPSNIPQITNVVNEKIQQAREQGKKLADEAWEEARKETKKYLEKMPQVKKVLEENEDKLKAIVASGGMAGSRVIKEIFEQAKRLAGEGESTEALEKFKRFVEEKTKSGVWPSGNNPSAKGNGPESIVALMEGCLREIPGSDKALQETPDLCEIIDLGKEMEPEMQAIVQETWGEIMQVLEKQLKKSKDLAARRKEAGDSPPK